MNETLTPPTQEAYLLQQEISPEMAAVTALELAPDPVLRAEQLGVNTTAEGILQAITGLHAAVAPEVPHTPSEVARTINNPDTGEIKAVLLNPQERLPLFAHTAQLIKDLYARTQPGQEQAYLKRAANALALSVVLTHTFEDGNGRTARTLAHAIRNGSALNEEGQQDLKVVAANRPSTGFRINSYLPTNEGKNLTPAQLVEAAVAIDVPLADQAAYQEIVNKNFSIPYDDQA